MLVGQDNKVELLKDINVPQKLYTRLCFGIPALDEIFGGQEEELRGILPGSSFLFSGTPGAGKSTLALQMADLLALTGENVLYNMGEESKPYIKIRADRLKLKGEFAITQIEEVDDLLRMCNELGITVLFQDSLQTLKCGDLKGDALLKEVTARFQKWKEFSECTLFLIGHSNKKGEFAGPNAIKHYVDVHAHFTVSPEDGGRIFELQKNRNGPATIPYQFTMGPEGLNFQELKLAASDEAMNSGGKSKVAERKERVVKVIREALLAGHKVNGYNADEFVTDGTVTGGTWRVQTDVAVRQLQKEGYVVMSVTIDRRNNFYIDPNSLPKAEEPANEGEGQPQALAAAVTES